MLDSFNREISYLRISVTDRCNLRCVYCMPEEGVPKCSHADCLSFEEIRDAAAEAVRLGVRKIRLTGGEPLVRKGIVELVAMLRAIDGLEILAMTSNGHLLDRYAPALKEAGLDSINISLDTLNADRYSALTRGGDIRQALNGLEAARSAGFALKINMVISDDTTLDEMDAMKTFCEEKGIKLQRIREYELARDKFKDEDIVYQRPPPCGQCNRIRLLANGILKPCLHSDQEIKLDPENPAESIKKTIRDKPACGQSCSNRSMVEIGG